jgi:hypothetical protein
MPTRQGPSRASAFTRPWLKGVVVSRTIKVKLWDKIAAHATAMKHLGLYDRDNARGGENLQIRVDLV